MKALHNLPCYRIIYAISFKPYDICMYRQRGVGIIAFFIIILLLAAFIALGIYLIRLDDIIRDRF